MNRKNSLPNHLPENRPLSQSRGDGLTRRTFLGRAVGLAAGIGLGGGLGSALAAPRNRRLPTPQRSGIDHVVVVMMENRSFDHFLGWLPGAEGRQGGLIYKDRLEAPHPTWLLSPDYQGCAYSDPDHSYEGGRAEYNGGACDGWLKAGANDLYSIGYYQASDLPFLANAATAWTTCDHYFSAIMAGTYANRIYQHSAQTDRRRRHAARGFVCRAPFPGRRAGRFRG
jgi:phospholipase C